ncbi:glucosaminidase domain-containing protein [Bacillus sp. B15-48]|uniref:glucosaminidase domain-containing protein n=1 Tax=Bacillus sp. B15-48 TaxID=1548601 RepID=UPI00193F50A8|nr:glucosaminidase domain-containing protein [Bacillus sp. B15-48]MBM4764126.1 conjugal transfer protein [Bacillus sp. B15-48]
MDVRFLPLILNQTFMNFSSTNSASSTNNNMFANMLTESLLRADSTKHTNLNRFSSANSVQPMGPFPSLLNSDSILIDLLKNPNINTAQTSLSDSLNVSNSSLQATSTEANELNAQLKGVLQNKGDLFVEAGKKYNLSPALLAAISIHETGNGSSNAARFKFNVAGMMGKNGLKTYDSVADSIFDMARNLRQNYLDKGLTTLSQIGAKYAPVGAANDPTNLNNHWVTGVKRQFETLTKTTDFA